MVFRYRIGKYQSIPELQESFRALQNELESRIEALNIEPRCFEETVLLKYIELRSTTKVAEYIKAQSIRAPSGNVFAGSDVSEIIKDGTGSPDCHLLEMAREIFKKNTEAVVRAYG